MSDATNPVEPATQSLILKNAISSLRIGLEDYELSKKDPDRTLSSIRNVYASLLLFLKEGLCRISPMEPAEGIINSRLEPVLLEKGSLGVNAVGENTIDVGGIKSRYRLLRVDIGWRSLDSIRDERNKIEHYYSTTRLEVLQSIICDASSFIIEISKKVFKTDPSSLLGLAWQQMLDIKSIYDPIKDKCNRSLQLLRERKFISETTMPLIEDFACSECGARLLYLYTGYTEPKERANFDLKSADNCKLVCYACHAEIPLYEAFENFINDNYELSYSHFKYGGSPNVKYCPGCGHETFVDDSLNNFCLYCGYKKDYELCQRCGASLSIEEQECDGFCFDCYDDYQESLEDD